jgi:hypothetical protein
MQEVPEKCTKNVITSGITLWRDVRKMLGTVCISKPAATNKTIAHP